MHTYPLPIPSQHCVQHLLIVGPMDAQHLPMDAQHEEAVFAPLYVSQISQSGVSVFSCVQISIASKKRIGIANIP